MIIFILLLSLSLSFVHAQKITILHTNDHHGHFSTNKNGEFGLAAQSTLVREIREEVDRNKGYILVLSGGDINTGTPESDMFDARPDILAMNEIKYDAMVPGNHEFDNPLSVLKKQAELAQFPFLAANIKDEKGELIFRSFISLKIGDKKIAIVGIANPDTPKITVDGNTRGLVFESPFTKTKELIKDLKADHDLVIALSHLGFYANESHGKDFPGDITLAREIPEIDVIIGAHTHTKLSEPYVYGKTIIVQAKEGGQFLGRLDLELENGGFKFNSYDLIPVTNIRPDPKILTIIKPFIDEADKKFGKKVGIVTQEFIGGRTIKDKGDRPLGKLVSEAQKEAAQVDLAIVDSRGLRTGLPKGMITLKDILNVSPFGNTLCTVEITGRELWDALQVIHENFFNNSEPVYFSGDFNYKVIDGKISSIFFQGQSIAKDSEKKWTLTMNNYLATGGSGFYNFSTHKTFKYTSITDANALEQFIEKRKTISPQDFKVGLDLNFDCNNLFRVAP